jgi:hypothetical protein
VKVLGFGMEELETVKERERARSVNREKLGRYGQEILQIEATYKTMLVKAV